MANFFIRRPIFAWVLAIILMMAGALAILQLPVAQYPTIAPPAVSVSANYPGADAQTVQDTVTQVIEQNMNGIDNLMYMSSTSDSAGSVTITLTFQSGTDPDIAQVQVQNKLQLATPLLPQEVQQQGISVEKSSSSYLMVAGFVSDNPDTTQDDISDYVASNVKDTLSRLNGVGDVQLFGAQYAEGIFDWGREHGLGWDDLAATATELTAWSIADAYERYVLPKYKAAELLVGGGGSYNKTLLSRLSARFERFGVEVKTQEDLGFSSDAKEAVAFALLGDRCLAGLSNSLPAVTGAANAAIMGKISLPPR